MTKRTNEPTSNGDEMIEVARPDLGGVSLKLNRAGLAALVNGDPQTVEAIHLYVFGRDGLHR
jgi:hypothetical protein